MVQSLIFVTVTMLHYVFPKHPQKQRNIVTLQYSHTIPVTSSLGNNFGKGGRRKGHFFK